MLKYKSVLQHIAIHKLVSSPYQPREQFDTATLQLLADSIRCTHGLLQPIIVRPLSNETYEIIAGERRFHAAKLAGFTSIPCLITHYSDEQALQASIIENVHRNPLNPIEKAKAYQHLIQKFNYSHEEVAAAVGQSRTSITNALRLLKLDLLAQHLLIEGQLSEGHAKVLASLDQQQQKKLAQHCVLKGWNVRKIEHAVKQLQNCPSKSSPTPQQDTINPNIRQLETALSEYLGNTVAIYYHKNKSGHIQVHFNTIDELEGCLDRIGFNQYLENDLN